MPKKLTKLTPKKGDSTRSGKAGWRARFVNALTKRPNISRACSEAGISRAVAYTTREESKAFSRAWDQALQSGIEALEDIAWDRAEKSSDVLAIFLLKAHAPAKYRETLRTEVTGANGQPVTVEHRTKQPINYARMGELTRELLGVPGANGSGEPVHPAHTNGASGNGASHNGN